MPGNRRRNALVWELHSNEVDHVSYVCGTMHVRDTRAFSRISDMNAAIQACSLFLSEVDLDLMSTAAYPQWNFLPQGTTLQTLLGYQYEKHRRMIVKAFQIDLEQYSNWLPMVVVQVITAQVLENDHAQSLDFALWHKAQISGLQCGGVESLDEHFGVLTQIPLNAQVSMLKAVSRDVAKFRKNIHQLCECYAQGEIHKLYKKSIRSIGGLKEIMLHRRNRHMAMRFLEHHRKEPTFMAIGAAHLSGEKGIIHQLQLSDQKIRPLI